MVEPWMVDLSCSETISSSGVAHSACVQNVPAELAVAVCFGLKAGTDRLVLDVLAQHLVALTQTQVAAALAHRNHRLGVSVWVQLRARRSLQ